MIGSLHPALLPLIGSLIVPFLQGRARQAFLLIVPVASLLNLLLLPDNLEMTATFMGQSLVLAQMSKMSFIFGLLFHLALIVAVVYSLHVEDRWQSIASLMYPGAAIAAAFAGDFMTLFASWEILAVSSVLFIWARGTEESLKAGNRYFFQQIVSGLLILAGIGLRLQSGGDLFIADFALDRNGRWLGCLTNELLGTETNGLPSASSVCILLGIGIKCAFPFLHTWLVDGYASSTHAGPVFLCAFTTKVAVCTLARCFAGADILITIGAVMATFPIFYAVIENDLRRVLCYSKINQIGFMVVGIGIGTATGVNGAVAHAFSHVFYKGLLFMTMGAVLFRTGKIGGNELGGLYKSMPWTTGFCMVGAAAISAFPLFSGFISKSLIMKAAYDADHNVVFFLLLFAAAGVFHHAGIKIPFFAFFAHDSKQRVKEAPLNMRVAMGMNAFLCIGLGIGYKLLYAYLPLPWVDGKTPGMYGWGHISEQMQILFFSALAFTSLMLWKQYPPELPSVNLDADWFLRKGWKHTHAFIVGPLDRMGTYFSNLVLDRAPRAIAGVHPIEAAKKRLDANWMLSAPTVIVMIALLGFLVLNYAR